MRGSLQLGKYVPIPMVLILSSVMLLITEILLTRGQLPIHGREARDSLQLGKYGPIPLVLMLNSVMLLITEILSTRGQLTIHGREARDLLQLGKYGPISYGPYIEICDASHNGDFVGTWERSQIFITAG